MVPLVRHYPTNRVGRTFVSGDWHGCYNQVRMLLDAVGFDFSKDVLYQTGDIGNRGPHSRKCYELLDEDWFRPVQGNHESELVRAAKDPMYNWEEFLRHGSRWAYNLPRHVLQTLTAKIAKLPCAIVVGEGNERFNVFHAEWHADDAKLDALSGCWAPVWLIGGRELFHGRTPPERHAGLSPSFVGHNIVKRPKMIGSHIFIDTGSYHGEFNPTNPSGISFVEPATQRVWQYSLGKVIETT
jgi:serine/threonine protein phosphatase 1